MYRHPANRIVVCHTKVASAHQLSTVISPSLRRESRVLCRSKPSLTLLRATRLPICGVDMATNIIFPTARPIEPILEHEIRIRAYELYEQHGARNGHALDDWLQAEYEVVRQRGVVGLALPQKRVIYR